MMIEHKQLLELIQDEDDYPVMLYLAEIGTKIDWREIFPEELLYIPESLFELVGRKFIDLIGLDGYYGKTILDNQLIEILCCQREKSIYSSRYLVTLETIRNFINLGLQKHDSHLLVFEGP